MNKNINYNEKYILIVKDKQSLKKYEYSFKNIIVLSNDTKCLKDTKEFIEKNNFKNLIFLDYDNIFIQLINSFKKVYHIKFICSLDLGTLSDIEKFNNFSKVYELYNEKIIDEIGFIDKAMYDSFKDKIKCSYIMLDVLEDNKLYIHDDTVRIINCSSDVYHSYYNELSAITLGNRKVRITSDDKVVKNFLKLFNVNYEKDKNQFEKSIVDLYINFSDNDILKILKSMDRETLCIVGNTTLFDSSPYLKEKLVMKSDDDINEIKERIEDVIKCKDKIINEYKKFRKEYSTNSRKSILNFTEEIESKNKKIDDLLISVIVPVYNSEKFLESTTRSIIAARIKSMEIIFVNDGSLDNSESIIMKYQKKYPKLIRYFKKKNEGPGSARNLGLKNARGKYISSVDSDDQISKNFYKDALKYLKEDIDMVIYDWKTFEKDKTYDTVALDYIFNEKSVYEGILFTTIMASQCNKIIKKSIYEEMKLSYGPGKYEDFDTNAISLLNVKTFKYIRKPYYKYYIRNGSIMRSSPEYDMINAIKLLDDRLKVNYNYLNVDIEEYKYYLYSWRIEEYIINVLYDLELKDRNDMIDFMTKKIKDIMIDIFECSYYKNMLNKIDEDKRKYLIERNKAIKNDQFKTFISRNIKDKSYFKISPVEILYSKKNKTA